MHHNKEHNQNQQKTNKTKQNAPKNQKVTKQPHKYSTWPNTKQNNHINIALG